MSIILFIVKYNEKKILINIFVLFKSCFYTGSKCFSAFALLAGRYAIIAKNFVFLAKF